MDHLTFQAGSLPPGLALRWYEALLSLLVVVLTSFAFLDTHLLNVSLLEETQVDGETQSLLVSRQVCQLRDSFLKGA